MLALCRYGSCNITNTQQIYKSTNRKRKRTAEEMAGYSVELNRPSTEEVYVCALITEFTMK